MKVKTSNVVKHLAAHGRVAVRLDRASGLTQIVITKRAEGYVVGKTPGSGLTIATEAEVVAFLDKNAIYVISWS